MKQPIENKVMINSEKQMENKPTLSRRKFLVRAGAGSLPVVMSLQSGSAWGCIELNCTPGQPSFSASGSQVASVTANKKTAPYQRPQWSNIEEIQLAFSKDFNSVLLATYNRTLTTRTNTGKRDAYGNVIYKFNTLDKTNFQNWWDHVRVNGNGVEIYHNSPGTTGIISQCKVYNKWTTVEPGNFNKSIIISKTPCSNICGDMPGTVGGILFGADCPDRSVIAALVGSIWERHKYYTDTYSKPKCFPEPSVIVNAYIKAKAQGKLKDLHSLIKLYMSPAK